MGVVLCRGAHVIHEIPAASNFCETHLHEIMKSAEITCSPDTIVTRGDKKFLL